MPSRSPAGEFPQGKRLHHWHNGRCDCADLILRWAQVNELREDGLPARAIAHTLGIGLTTVYAYTKSPFVAPQIEELPETSIPFFPADLPRLEQDPFWTPEMLWAHLPKDRIMIVEAQNLLLHNIGQLIMVVSEGNVLMGKLERVKSPNRAVAQAKVSLRISGETVTLAPDSQVQIRRSPELHELRMTSMAMEEVLDGVDA